MSHTFVNHFVWSFKEQSAVFKIYPISTCDQKMEESQVQPDKRISYEELKSVIDSRNGQGKIRVSTLLNCLSEEIVVSEGFNHSKYKNALKLFGSYLKTQESELLLDEELIDCFRLWLNNDNASGAEGKTAAANIVHVINVFVGKSWLKTSILVGSPVRKLFRFKQLDEQSLEMFVHFEKYARQIRTNRLPVKDETGRITVYKEFVLLKKELAPIPKFKRLDQCLTILLKLGKRNINEVTKEALLNDSLVGLSALKDLCPVFANFHKWGFLEVNPFSNIDYMKPKYNQNIEFITKESIDLMLTAVKSLNGKTDYQIRALCLCVLAYDSCMRIGELLSLQVSDLSQEDGVDILRIRSEVQKGQDKNEKYLVFHFDETSQILHYYLNRVRRKNSSTTDILFIGEKGQSVSRTSAREHVRKVQRELGMQLYHDAEAIITPHHFRRTFGTLNAPGIGLNLPIDELADRMRHNDPATTRGHYISQNVYLERMKLRESIIKKKRVTSEAYSDEEVDKFLNWLKVDKAFPKELVSEIRERIYSDTAKKAMKKYDPQAAEVFDTAEVDALKILVGFNVKLKGLRIYCLKQGKASVNEDGVYLYSSQFLEWLCENYILLKRALERLCITKSTVYNNSEIFMPISIGRTCMVHESSIEEYIHLGSSKS